MGKVLAIYGSPRRSGNTSLLLQKAVQGVRESGNAVVEIVLRDLMISPCLEIYACKQDGICAIKDDFQKIYDLINQADGIVLASPIFFYAVSAHTKAMMDRCQSFWVKKYWIEKKPRAEKIFSKKGMFISVGATNGKKLFDGALLTVKYFFAAIDTELSETLLYRGLDFEGDVLKHPHYMEEALETGRRFGGLIT